MAIADAILTNAMILLHVASQTFEPFPNAMILLHVASQTFEPFLLFVFFPCLGKCAQLC
jgi:NADH:ubiquinone oxidoreductase subunit 5 (subunit L)/multisubunit Na+/H+ antiporter MnhA subunit